MSKYLNLDVARRAHIATLYLFIVIMFIVSAGLWDGWKTASQNIRVTIPPDPRTGVTVDANTFHPAFVFDFAMMTMRTLYRWENTGEKDYGKKIENLQYRFTPAYHEYLKRDMNIKYENGELKDRTRFTMEIPGSSLYQDHLVTVLQDGSWIVTINLEIVERVASIEAKRVKISYPLHVMRMNIDPELNVYGLAINGYPSGQRPFELLPKDLVVNDQ